MAPGAERASGAKITAMTGRGLADLHMHTDHSDGWPSPDALVGYLCRESRLNVAAVTDHDTLEGAWRAAEIAARMPNAPEVVVGEEVSSRQGHIVGLFLTTRVRPGLSARATIDQIHQQGGIAIAAHPFWRTERQGRRNVVHGVGWDALHLEFDAVEVENGTPGFYLFNQMARRLNEVKAVAEVGNSDAHILDAVGRAYTSFPGHTAAHLRLAVATATTKAHRDRYRAMGLVRYAAWGLSHQRLPAAPAGAAGGAG